MPKKLTNETSFRIAFLSRKQNDTGCWFLDAGFLKDSLLLSPLKTESYTSIKHPGFFEQLRIK
jgi:hypothetical protein